MVAKVINELKFISRLDIFPETGPQSLSSTGRPLSGLPRNCGHTEQLLLHCTWWEGKQDAFTVHPIKIRFLAEFWEPIMVGLLSKIFW